MQIHNINNNKNTNFGLYFDFLLSKRHADFLRPIIPKLGNIAKTVDVSASSRMRVVEKCADAEIYSDCIEFLVSANEKSPACGMQQKVRIYTSKLINASEEQLQTVREKIVAAIDGAAKKATKVLSLKDFLKSRENTVII